jgi:dipeptidyl aminopeptidase/acylaminoacyl peptidase
VAAVLERELDWSALPPSTPPSLARLMRRCLEKDRAHRLRDIADARSDLDEALREVEAGPRASTVPPVARVRWLAPAALIGGVTVVTTALWIASRAAPRTAATGPAFRRVVADGSFATEPAISRDGSLVVYASDRAGDGQLDLWLQRTAGGPPIRLTADPADDREPNISPDGSLVAFRSLAGRSGVYVIPVLGGNPRLVAEGGQRPQFSSDGGRITYWTGSWLGGPRTEGSAVFVVPATGGQTTRIAPEFAVARSPVWAPSGEALLFFGSRENATRGPAEEVDWWWAPLDGSRPIATGAYAVMKAIGLSGNAENNMINPTPDALPLQWTQDGVIFSARLGDAVNLWRLQIDGRGRVVADSLVRLTYGAGADLDPSVDGTGRIAFRVAAEIAVSLRLPLDSNAGRTRGAVVRETATAGGNVNGRNSLDDAGRRWSTPKRDRTRARFG